MKKSIPFLCVLLCAFLSSSLPAWSANSDKCGDGVCDDFERQTGRCPRDCARQIPRSAQRQNVNPGETVIPPSLSLIDAKDLPAALQYQGLAMGFMRSSAEEAEFARESGAKVARKAFWFMEGEFREKGPPVSSLLNDGFQIIANVCPMPPGPAQDYGVFLSKFRALLSGYKKAVQYWQLGNEPDLAWKMRGYGPADFIKFFLACAPAIREECPDCKIVLAGISNQYDSGDNYEFFRQVVEGIKRDSPEAKPFDAFDIHIYTDDGNYKKASKAVRDYKKLLKEAGYSGDIEFIATEIGTYSGQPNTKTPQGRTIAFQSEDFQAKMLIKLYVEFFYAGITKGLWEGVFNNYKFGLRGNEGGYFDLTGLIYNGKGSYDLKHNIAAGTKKKAFYAYKVLAAKVQGKSRVELVSENVYKFSNGRDAVYVAWSDDPGAGLPSSISGEVKITDYLGNEEVQDASSVTLTDSPVFIDSVK